MLLHIIRAPQQDKTGQGRQGTVQRSTNNNNNKKYIYVVRATIRTNTQWWQNTIFKFDKKDNVQGIDVGAEEEEEKESS